MLLRLLTVAAFVVYLAAPASAGVIFQDDFEADTVGIPQGSLVNWNIAGGTVDVVGGGTFGFLCNNGSAGQCLDLDGTPGNATIVTKTALDLVAGNYQFSFDYGNNFGTNNALFWAIGTGAVDAALGSVVSDLVPNDFYSSSATGFTLASDLSGVFISFQQLGPEDNGGTVLDNVVLEYLGASSVPEPGSLMLLALGLLGLGSRRRLKQSI